MIILNLEQKEAQAILSGAETFFVELKNTPSISKRSYDFCCSLNRVFPTYFIISSEGKSNNRLQVF